MLLNHPSRVSKADKNLDVVLEGGMNENGCRKRKIPTEEEPECSGDGRVVGPHRCTSKIQHGNLKLKKTKSHHDYGGDCEPTTHRYFVQLHSHKSALLEETTTGSSDNNCLNTRPATQTTNLQFDCQLGDIWINKYAEIKPHQKISTGDASADTILPLLELQGYSMQEHVARGRFGSVMLAYSKQHSKFVAVKFLIKNYKRKMRKSSEMVSSTELPEEIVILQKLKHVNIAQMLEHHLINGRACLIMEFCENGNINQLLNMRPGGFLAENIARKYFKDMVNALQYIHLQCIVHRDIKCENFVVDRHDRVKLCDLGSAKHYTAGDPFFKGSCYSIAYQAPETLEGKPCDPRVLDLWALAVVLYIMLTSRKPFGNDAHDILTSMRRGVDCGESSPLRLSREAKCILRRMLNYVPEVRYSVNRIENSEWYRMDNRRVAIGNYHLVQHPQKFKEGTIEKQLKDALHI